METVEDIDGKASQCQRRTLAKPSRDPSAYYVTFFHHFTDFSSNCGGVGRKHGLTQTLTCKHYSPPPIPQDPRPTYTP